MMLDLRMLDEGIKQEILRAFDSYQQGDSDAIARIDRLLQEQFVNKAE